MLPHQVAVVVASLVGAVITMTGTGAVVVAWFVVPVLLVTLDEVAVPPRSDIPAGLDVLDEGMGCGSGGCWRELSVRPPDGQSAEEYADSLVSDGLGCEPRSWVDRRRVCTWANARGDVVVVSQQWSRAQSL